MDWKRKLRKIIIHQQEIEDALAAETKVEEEDEPDPTSYKRIRRLSELIRTAGGGRGAMNKWKSKVHRESMHVKMGYKATLLALCLAVVHVTSHLQGSRREGRMSVSLRHGGPFNEAMWLGQNGLMGFQSDIRDFIPQPRWNGFQQWPQPRDWQNSWNDNNNFFANGNNNMDPMFENNGDPWQIYQRLNPGVNTAATNPLVPSGGQVNGLNNGGPWNLLERNSQRFPIIPNRVNPGGFVRPNAGNNMFMDRNGFMNNQLSGSGFQANGDPFGQNLGLRNDQSQWA